jgi:hypothetical protein
VLNHLSRKYKDPDAVLDYSVDWSDWLVLGDTIASVAWTVPPGITSISNTYSTNVATIWLAAGTLGKVYTITCEVTTAAGRVEDHSFELQIVDK